MAFVYLLGTGAATASIDRTTTMLALEAEGELIVFDCGGDVCHQMKKCGLDPLDITLLIISHEHPDHVGGYPLFIEKMWLTGRTKNIPVASHKRGMNQAKKCFDIFDTERWENLPCIDWIELSLEPNSPVLESENWKITSSPGDHGVPTIGIRVENRQSGKILAYSCDTLPSQTIVDMGKGANIFIHEATGEGPVHSSISQAAEVAKAAEAEQLVLVHLPLEIDEVELSVAKEIHPDILIGEDCIRFEF